jgi:hypothetical protein
MFFVSWGSKGAVANVGDGGVRHCARCDKDAYFAKMIAYRVRHVYWLFRWVTDRTPYVQCGNCGSEYVTDESDVSSQEATAAIPFWDKRGWTIGAGAIASLVGLGTLAGATTAANNRAYVQTPHVGDIYEADMARMVKSPERPEMMTAMRVTAIKNGVVELEVANEYYTDSRGVDRDIREGKADNESYYAHDRLAVPMTALRKMYDEGVVQDVHRS